MKTALLIALIIGTASVANAQTGTVRAEECKLKLSQAPMIRGIRLGTTVDQTLAIFPGASDDQEVRGRLSDGRFGVQSVTLYPEKYGSKEKFEGVQSVNFGFLDGQLNIFSLTYNGPEWSSTEQFASRVAETLNLLPIESWRQAQFGMQLACDGFSVSALRGVGPIISIKNLQNDIDKILRERREIPKEKERRAFKPETN